MLYRQKFDTFIRRYDDIGYITNKSDFADRIVDTAGAVFLAALSREAQTLDTIALFRAHGNVYGDTVFLSIEGHRQILEAGFGGRLIPGTDFPITHYFNRKSGLSLENQYREDLAYLAALHAIPLNFIAGLVF